MEVSDGLQLDIELARPLVTPASARTPVPPLDAQKQRLLAAVVTTSDSSGYTAKPVPCGHRAPEEESYEIQIEAPVPKAAAAATPSLPLAAPAPRSIRWPTCSPASTSR